MITPLNFVGNRYFLTLEQSNNIVDVAKSRRNYRKYRQFWREFETSKVKKFRDYNNDVGRNQNLCSAEPVRKESSRRSKSTRILQDDQVGGRQISIKQRITIKRNDFQFITGGRVVSHITETCSQYHSNCFCESYFKILQSKTYATNSRKSKSSNQIYYY